MIEIYQVDKLELSAFEAVLNSSGLAERRPIQDRERLQRMLDNSNLIVVARDIKIDRIIGISRAITDYSYCCYLSDLAVDRAYQGNGIGRRLIEKTREAAGPETMCLLLSSPDAVPFYKGIGMPQPDNAFLFKRDH